MGKRQMRARAQGTHKNKYAQYSKAEEPIKPLNFENDDKNYDYFKAAFHPLKGIYVEPNNANSSIKGLWYFKNNKSYILQLRDYNKKTFEHSIEAFFNVAYIGKTEKGELKAIKRLIEPLLKRLENP